MSETRSLDDLTAAVATLMAKVADMESTAAARDGRGATGDTELAFRATPKAGTLFMHGQILDRAEYAALWAWAQANGGVVTGGYGTGNGTTTFTLPDMRGKVVRGASTASALGEQVGADSRALTTAQMPSHTHTATNTSDAHAHTGSTGTDSHTHSGSTATDGSHSGHNSGVANFWQSLNDGQGSFSVAANGQTSGGSHGHSFSTTSDGHSHTMSVNSDTHTHTTTVGSTGGTTPVDLRQASLGWHVAVWT